MKDLRVLSSEVDQGLLAWLRVSDPAMHASHMCAFECDVIGLKVLLEFSIQNTDPNVFNVVLMYTVKLSFTQGYKCYPSPILFSTM